MFVCCVVIGVMFYDNFDDTVYLHYYKFPLRTSFRNHFHKMASGGLGRTWALSLGWWP